MAICEIAVTRKEGLPDPRGNDVSLEANRVLGIKTDVTTATVYRVEGLDEEQAKLLAEKVLIDPITEEGSIGGAIAYAVAFVGEDFVHIDRNSRKTLEVAYKPEVTDPISETIDRAAGDLHLPLEAARVSTKYTFGSNITVQQASEIANRVLVNPTVQETVKKKPETLVIKGERGPVETISLADKTDRELDEISTQRKLHLNTEEMRVAQREFKRLERDATDVELEILGARWSEHCVHKTFNARVMTPNGEKRPLFGRIKDTSRQYLRI